MVITLLSDFGDIYPASMKGVILDIYHDANIVDISHSIPQHDIRAGAFVLQNCAKYFPPGTVHIAVVDPGVGTKRRRIAVRAVSVNGETQYFIGPDNGLIIPAAKSIGSIQVYEISNTDLFRRDISATFHGRDIFAPVGAYISKGLRIEETGAQIEDFKILDFGEGKKINGSLKGEVIYVDAFGNIITNITGTMIDFRPGDEIGIDTGKAKFSVSYGYCKEGDALLLAGSHGFLEIAVNMGNAAKIFNKKPGDDIIIKYP